MQIEYRTLSHPAGSIDIRIKGGFSTQYQKWKTYTMEEGWRFMFRLQEQTDMKIVCIDPVRDEKD